MDAAIVIGPTTALDARSRPTRARPSRAFAFRRDALADHQCVVNDQANQEEEIRS